jgi:hypothetical protein
MIIRLYCPIYENVSDVPDLEEWVNSDINTNTYWVYKLFQEYDEEELFDETYFDITVAQRKNGEMYEKSVYNSEDILYRLEDSDSNEFIDFYGYKNKSGILVTRHLTRKLTRKLLSNADNYKNIMNKLIEIVYVINTHEPNFKLYIEKSAFRELNKQMWENVSIRGSFQPLTINRKKLYEWVPNKDFNSYDYGPVIIRKTIDKTFKELEQNDKTLPEIKSIIDSYIGPLTKKRHFGGKRKTRKTKKTKKMSLKRLRK